MSLVGDPVASGFVASLARPGGNITGLSLATTDISAKWLELARAVAPKARIALLANPNQQTAPWHIGNIENAAKKLGSDVFTVSAATPESIEPAFTSMARERAGVVVVLSSGMFDVNMKTIVQLGLKFRMATIASSRVHAEDGVLISYGQDYGAFVRRAATYVDKIFKGAKPADLPIEQPTILELVINRATAMKLGLTIPQELILRADRVID
jgi:putative ABC transport system substrate-binding protein